MAVRVLEDKLITLDKALEESFKASIGKVISQFFGCEVEVGQAISSRSVDAVSDLSGVVALFQKDIQGIMDIGFPKSVIFKLLSKIYLKEFEKIDQSVIDGVGEITNSIYGQLKRDMNARGYELKMTIPGVIVGKGHSVMPYSKGPMLIFPVSTEYGKFHASIILGRSVA